MIRNILTKNFTKNSRCGNISGNVGEKRRYRPFLKSWKITKRLAGWNTSLMASRSLCTTKKFEFVQLAYNHTEPGSWHPEWALYNHNRISTTGERSIRLRDWFLNCRNLDGFEAQHGKLEGKNSRHESQSYNNYPNRELIDKYKGLGERVLVRTIDSMKEMLTEPVHPNQGKYLSG